MGQGEEVYHLKFLDLVNKILNDKTFRISRNHFSADKLDSFAYFFLSFASLGLNPPQKPRICFELQATFMD